MCDSDSDYGESAHVFVPVKRASRKHGAWEASGDTWSKPVEAVKWWSFCP